MNASLSVSWPTVVLVLGLGALLVLFFKLDPKAADRILFAALPSLVAAAQMRPLLYKPDPYASSSSSSKPKDEGR